MTAQTITTATTTATRIAECVNRSLTQGLHGGFLVFDRETGAGGAWYSAGSRPDLDGCIAITLRGPITAEEVQWTLDRSEGVPACAYDDGADD